MITGSEALIRSLLIEGVDTVFGIPGGSGFNIDSITVGQSEEPGLSRMVIVTSVLN
ncbi:acetolactate synthase small subunit [Paenibacillus sp. V4I9]|nr:acetolactate synthase small subunit [Paenibacillus sp. V4I9]